MVFVTTQLSIDYPAYIPTQYGGLVALFVYHLDGSYVFAAYSMLW